MNKQIETAANQPAALEPKGGTIMKNKVLLTVALIAVVAVSSFSLAKPAGGGGTKRVCKDVQIPVIVSDGTDKYGFPINPHVVMQTITVCKIVKA